MTPTRVRRTVTIRLRAGSSAQNFQKAMAEMAALAVTFPNAETAIVEMEDAPKLLDAHRLASRGESLDRMWDILAAHPRYDHETKHKQRAIEEINRAADLQTREGMLYAFGLLMLVTSNAELRTTLEPQLEGLWKSLPEATLWLVTAEEPLLPRLGMSQLLFQFEHTPDLDVAALMSDSRRSLEAQSLTNRIATSDIVQPIFLAFSPAATGFAMPWLPHTLAIEFGAVADLRRQYPVSLNAIYEPRVLSPPVNLEGGNVWINSIPKTSLGTLLAWWVSRLDLLYAIITDPTRFSTSDGDFDSGAQLAFRLTVERVLADLRVLNASPQVPALARLGTTFDLLDKLETLLGYGPKAARKFGREWRSGNGFRRLLDRREALPLMERGFSNMPSQLGSRFAARASELFDTTYQEIEGGVLHGRLAEDGIRVGRIDQDTMSIDDYAGSVVRAVRNSSHGLLDQLAGPDAEVAATHAGALPETLSELVGLIAWALLSDPERLWSMQVWD
ncbi:MAG: hypothetical protein ACRDJ3_04110 [Solirubrobacteraceae bacterium]